MVGLNIKGDAVFFNVRAVPGGGGDPCGPCSVPADGPGSGDGGGPGGGDGPGSGPGGQIVTGAPGRELGGGQ